VCLGSWPRLIRRPHIYRHFLCCPPANVLVEHVTEEGARSNGTILTAPMIHYGFNEHNMGFPGTISIREYVFIDFCYDVAHSFIRQGYHRIVFVNGHGSNQMLCNLAARRIVNTTPALAAAVAQCSLPSAAWLVHQAHQRLSKPGPGRSLPAPVDVC